MIEYLNRLANRLFKVDDKGRLVFYPWSYLGKGYIVTDEATEKSIRLFVSYYYVTCFVLVAVFLVTDYMTYPAVFILLLTWILGVKYLTRKLEPAERKLTFAESMTSIAKSRRKTTLLLAVIVGLFLVAMSIQMYFSHKSIWTGLAAIFFIALTALNGYVLYLKNR